MPTADPAPTAPLPTASSALERMHLVVTGHVDHGKSTIIGRLLADTGSLPDGRLESVRANCERNAKPFEYAFLLDALRDEQAQGITIDAARVFFKTARRHYIVIDAPGHVEFLKNMVTGASRAEAAVLVIDAAEGIQENSRRHGYLLAMLGIRQIVVVINKMDLVGFRQEVFERVSHQYREFLDRVGMKPAAFLPVSGFKGDNIAVRSTSMPWYGGPTVLEALDRFIADQPAVDRPLRIPVQGVYKFTAQNDERRIIAGSIDAGRVRVGDDVVFYPSGKRTRVRTIEGFNRAPQTEATAPHATGFTLEEQIFVTRGELAARVDEPPPLVSTRLRVSIFWLGRSPLVMRKEYVLKLATARVPARVETIDRVIDASDLTSSSSRSHVERHEVAECILVLSRPIAFDRAEDCAGTGRFVLVDEYEISGGGIVREALPDNQTWVRDKVLRRNLKWTASGVSEERRADRFSQRPALLMITGERDVDRKRLGRELEIRLFEDGRIVYFLAIGNVLYGVDADLERTSENRGEHLRRLSEVINILLDTGMIVIATAVSLNESEIDIMRTAVGRERVSAVWVGDRITTDLTADLALTEQEAVADGAGRLRSFLQDVGVIFKPW
jgi:bifunctional enzyme CysN/CysC